MAIKALDPDWIRIGSGSGSGSVSGSVLASIRIRICKKLIRIRNPATHCQRYQVCWLLSPHPHTVKDFRFVGYCYLTYTLSKISGLLVTVTSRTHCQRSQVCWLLLPHLHTVKDLKCVGYCYPHLHTVKDLRFVGYCYLTSTLSKISGLFG